MTPVFEKESEAWDAIADVLEMLGEMPPHCDGIRVSGLCAVLFGMAAERDISNDTFWRMDSRLYSELNARRPASNWLASPWAHLPRIEYARKFAEDARKEGK